MASSKRAKLTRISLLLAFVLAAAAGCTGTDQRLERSSIADQRASDGTTPVGVLAEDLRIDGLVADLVPISGLRVAEDGTIVIGQPQDMLLRFFGADGESLGTFGSRGQGPEQFASLWGSGWLADTLWAWDNSLARMTLVSPARQLVRTIPVATRVGGSSPGVGELPASIIPAPAALFPDGRVVAYLGTMAAESLPASWSNQQVVGVVTLDGQLVNIAGRVPHGNVSIRIPGGSATVPFPNRGWPAVSRSGKRIAGAFTSLAGDDADTFVVSVWNSDGTLAFSRRYPFDPVPIPARVADSAYRATLERLPDTFRGDFLSQAGIPTVYPPLTNLRFGEDGTLWVEMLVRESGRPYDVLDAEGARIGQVVVPRNSRIAAAQLDRIWVIERDELDVESVVRYSIAWE